MSKVKQNMLVYRFTQAIAGTLSTIVFKRKFIRNELKDAKGPIVLLGNHQAALDFTTLIGATKRPITFVVSDSFYNTLPIKSLMDKIGVIPKQQFQTTIKEIIQMRTAVKDGKILMFYPAGLMCEDGLSTPIPSSTYAFLKRLDADVYIARTTGTYFCTPKWSSKTRPGRTYMDIYKLISREDMATSSPEQIEVMVKNALLFDAYREQEQTLVKYIGGNNVEGLENVLYICPHCKKEFTIKVKNKSTLYCTECGFEHTSDKYGFLHNSGKVGEEIRYVSDWSRFINDEVGTAIQNGTITEISADATIQTINIQKKKYVDVGRAKITLNNQKFIIDGIINQEQTHIEVPTAPFSSIPFKPGCRFEIQHNKCSYRCVLDDGKLAQKFVNIVKKYYELNEIAQKNSAESK